MTDAGKPSDDEQTPEVEVENTTPQHAGDAEPAEAVSDALSEPEPIEIPAEAIAEDPPAPRRWSVGGALALVLGGIIAAVVGFLFAWVIAPDGWPIDTQKAAIAALDDRIAKQEAEQSRLLQDQTALTMRLSKAEGALATATALRDEVSELANGLSDLNDRVAVLDARPVIETTPDVGAEVADALKGYRGEVETLKADVAEQAARAAALSDKFDTLTADLADRMKGAEALANEAKQVERAVLAQGALAALGRAITTGAPFGEQLAELAATADMAPPAALSAAAPDGIPTLSALQDSFPMAARAALAASLTVDTDAGLLGRLGDFLKVQTGARSLTPKEGDDPDAVLSRAEQAMREGRVAAAFELVAILPQPGQAAMADWIQTAQLHADTMAAFDALTSALSPN